MPTTPKNATSPATRDFYTPEDFCGRTFFDAFADAFTSPEDLPLHQLDYGVDALIRDRKRIREYFDKAVVHEGFDPAEKETKSKRLHKVFVVSRKVDNGDSDKLVISRQITPKESGKVFVLSVKEK